MKNQDEVGQVLVFYYLITSENDNEKINQLTTIYGVSSNSEDKTWEKIEELIFIDVYNCLNSIQKEYLVFYDGYKSPSLSFSHLYGNTNYTFNLIIEAKNIDDKWIKTLKFKNCKKNNQESINVKDIVLENK